MSKRYNESLSYIIMSTIRKSKKRPGRMMHCILAWYFFLRACTYACRLQMEQIKCSCLTNYQAFSACAKSHALPVCGLPYRLPPGFHRKSIYRAVCKPQPVKYRNTNGRDSAWLFKFRWRMRKVKESYFQKFALWPTKFNQLDNIFFIDGYNT